MAKKRTSYPKMDCVGYQAPQFSHENKAGMSFSIYYCEGCGTSKIIPDIHAPESGPPMFFKKGCGCTNRKELTEYSDSCKRCNGPIYLTPGAAMFRKKAGSFYVQRKEYCDACLDSIVFSGRCRNLGCSSIGGTGVVEATFGEQLSYEKKSYTFPPNNCPVCRKAIKAFKQQQEVRPTCKLCKRSFRVTYGVMIMTLKNEEKCEIPKECLRCRELSPDERRRLEQEIALDVIGLQRRNEIAKILSGCKDELKLEKERLATAKEEKKREFRKRLLEVNRLSRRDMRAVLHEAKKEGTLLSVLANPKDLAYQKLREALAHVTGGRGKMTDKEYRALPEAFRLVVGTYPTAMGLFERIPAYRGKGSSALHQHYEILSTAAIMNKPVKSRSGKELFIDSARDGVDFGAKFPRETSIFDVKSRHHEADTLVYKPASLFGEPGREVAIDAKYTKNNKYTNIPYEELKSIRQGFNNAKFHEFYFITNKEFSTTFINEVNKTNLELVRDYIAVNLKQQPTELGIMEKYDDAVEQFARKHDVKQIEMCEHVNYPGT